MRILITGVGITGKSSFRRLLVDELRKLGLRVEHFDADRFSELRDSRDSDLLPEVPDLTNDKIYIIEDVHGPVKNAVLPLGCYNLIFYIKPSIISHFLFWLNRIPYWYRSGKYNWEAKSGWMGSGKPGDIKNFCGIIKEFSRNMFCRSKWIRQDLKTMRWLNVRIVEACWSRKGPVFKLRV